MARYVVTYWRPGEAQETYEIGAKSDAEARIRFLNLSWVVFTEIDIVRVEAKEPGDGAPASPARPAPAVQTSAQPATDWRAECDALTDEIAKLADEAQAASRAGRHGDAQAKRAHAKLLASERALITKRNKGT